MPCNYVSTIGSVHDLRFVCFGFRGPIWLLQHNRRHVKPSLLYYLLLLLGYSGRQLIALHAIIRRSNQCTGFEHVRWVLENTVHVPRPMRIISETLYLEQQESKRRSEELSYSTPISTSSWIRTLEKTNELLIL